MDKFGLDYFIGDSFCIDVSCVKNGLIQIQDIISFENDIEKSDFLLLHTGISDFWGTKKYFESYPVLSEETAKFLADFSLKGAGMDAISFDPIDSKILPIHNIFLKKDIILIENLCNLKKIINRQFIFSCFPLKLENADGSPTRAAAII